MLDGKQIAVAPAYQRKFRWDPERSSKLIESLMLGVPVPSVFMATNEDNTWEVVDGVQRIHTIVNFAGTADTRATLAIKEPLRLTGLTKIPAFNGFTFEDLPAGLQRHFTTRPIKVITLSDKSDLVVRYDLFERLNTGGIILSPQEIRDCIYRGDFADWIEERTKHPGFRATVRLTPLQSEDATAEECVLRFFAFRDRYKEFDHSVKDFLNDYMKESSESFDYVGNELVWDRTFSELARVLPHGITRKKTRNVTPLNLFEGIAVGASFALDKRPTLDGSEVEVWLLSKELRTFTTGATNSRPAIKGRIEFCRDRFLGIPYVPGD